MKSNKLFLALITCTLTLIVSGISNAQQTNKPAPPPRDPLPLETQTSKPSVQTEENVEDLEKLKAKLIRKAFRNKKLRQKLVEELIRDERASQKLIELISKEQAQKDAARTDKPAPPPVDAP
ncbi:MAG: hypothetical protein K2W82_16155 [Candidatus Obscuribacterales bacterium]|nr:hypothetical protein [Candidatus Obscuribacterales bacterium]